MTKNSIFLQFKHCMRNLKSKFRLLLLPDFLNDNKHLQTTVWKMHHFYLLLLRPYQGSVFSKGISGPPSSRQQPPQAPITPCLSCSPSLPHERPQLKTGSGVWVRCRTDAFMSLGARCGCRCETAGLGLAASSLILSFKK